MKVTAALKLRIFHVVVHLALIPAVMYGSWGWWLAAFGMWFLTGCIGISLGFHRYFSHRSFTCPMWFENVMLFLGSMTGGGTPLSWVGIHRTHHKYSDTDKDPHGPVALTPFQSYTHQWQRPHIPRQMLRDLLKKKNVVFMHRHYWKIVLGWAALLTSINPMAGLFLFAVPAVFAYHTYAQVNTWCHMFGYQNFRMPGDRSSNNLWMFWAFGENFHNNHHKFPWSYRVGLRWFEYDPGAWLIEKTGILKTGRKPSDDEIASASR